MTIPTEAIEAAAEALEARSENDDWEWCLGDAKAALTAAAPAIQAAALRDAAEVFATGEWADAFVTGNVTDDVSAVKATDKWLTARADQLEGKTE